MSYSRPVTRDSNPTHGKRVIRNVDHKIFGKTADSTNKLNVQARPMRGGFRL